MSDAAPPGCPAHLDVERIVTDPFAELGRLAVEHWYAEGMDMAGEPLPWVLSHDGVRSAMRDRRLSPGSFVDDMIAQGLPVEVVHQFTPLFRRDGDAHRRHRALLAQAFTPRSVEQLRPVAARVAARLADEVAARGGTCELVSDFASVLPTEVFAALFGLPAEDRDRLASWAAVVVQAFQPVMTAGQVADIVVAAGELRSYCAGLIAERRATPADDLTTHLLGVEVDGERLDDDEVLATMSGFIFAGSETTKRQIVELVLAFVGRSDLWALVQDDPDLIPGAVEEVLRHRGIVPALSRVAREPYDRRDLHVPDGERLLVSIHAANHDPQVFGDPDRLDLDRPNAADHVTFGWGPHFCLGAGLARVELQEALRVLTARFGAPGLVGEDQSAAHAMVGPDEVHVRFPVG